MNKKLTIILAILCVTTLILSSCRKEIDVDLRNVDPVLVVEGNISDNMPAVVKLTTTKDYYQSNDFAPITSAVVTLTESGGITEQLQLVGDSVFVSKNIGGKIGKTYSLSIDYDGKTYTSTSKLLPPVSIDSVVSTTIPSLGDAFTNLIYTVYFTDPIGKELDYYRFHLFINETRILIDQNNVAQADIMDGQQLTSFFLIPTEDNNKNKVVFTGDTIRFELQTIDKDAYLFLSSLGNRGKTPPTSNITGGAIGYFCAYSKYSTSTIVK